MPTCRPRLLVPLLLLALAGLPAGRARADGPMQFDKLQFIILRRGAAWTPQATPELEKLQAAHLAHFGKMATAGKMVVAGPLDDQDDPTARGFCIYRVASLDEARKLAESDPMVQAGRLKVEGMSWYTQKGAMTFPLAEQLARKGAAEQKEAPKPAAPVKEPAPAKR